MQLRAMGPVQAGLATAMDLDAQGNAADAIVVLKNYPATLFSSQGLALYQKITDRQRAITQHTAAVSKTLNAKALLQAATHTREVFHVTHPGSELANLLASRP